MAGYMEGQNAISPIFSFLTRQAVGGSCFGAKDRDTHNSKLGQEGRGNGELGLGAREGLGNRLKGERRREWSTLRSHSSAKVLDLLTSPCQPFESQRRRGALFCFSVILARYGSSKYLEKVT